MRRTVAAKMQVVSVDKPVVFTSLVYPRWPVADRVKIGKHVFGTGFVHSTLKQYILDKPLEGPLIGLNRIQRDILRVNVGDVVEVEPFRDYCEEAESISIKIENILKAKPSIDLNEHCAAMMMNRVVTKGLKFATKLAIDQDVCLEVEVLDCKDYTVVGPETNIFYESKSLGKQRKPIIRSDMSLEAAGIGGLEAQFQDVLLRALTSRMLPERLVQELKMTHQRGMLFYGPPGCGKTLFATALANMLGAEFKTVSAADLLSRFVGQSEENVNLLFKPAHENPDKLYVFLFDEIESLMKRRGGAGNDHGDKVLNQLLSEIDGPKKLNNLLLIGTTNRPDLIDPAMKRPGRFGMHVQFHLPDEEARRKIFDVCISDRSKYGELDLDLLARKTENFSGAEIRAVVDDAIAQAAYHYVDFKNSGKDIKLVIEQHHLLSAITRIKPGLGSDAHTRSPFVEWCGEIKTVVDDCLNNISNLVSTNFVALIGPRYSGRQSLAWHIADRSGVKCIKAIDVGRCVGNSEHIRTQFDLCSQAREAILIIESLEDIVSYNSYRESFVPATVQTLVALLTSKWDNRLTVIITAKTDKIFDVLGMEDVIDRRYHMPNTITSDQRLLFGPAQASPTLVSPTLVSPTSVSPAPDELPACDFFRSLKISK